MAKLLWLMNLLSLALISSSSYCRSISKIFSILLQGRSDSRNFEIRHIKPMKDEMPGIIDIRDAKVEQQTVSETSILCELRSQDDMAMLLYIDRSTGSRRIIKLICPAADYDTVDSVEYIPETVNSDPHEFQMMILQYFIDHMKFAAIDDENQSSACRETFQKLFDVHASPLVKTTTAPITESLSQDEDRTSANSTAESSEIEAAPLRRLNYEFCDAARDAETLPEDLETSTYSKDGWKVDQVVDRDRGRMKCTVSRKRGWLGYHSRKVEIITADDAVKSAIVRGKEREPVE